MSPDLKESIRRLALALGFSLAGFVKPGKTYSYPSYQKWIENESHASMGYLATSEALRKRADTREVFGEDGIILVLAFPYPSPIQHAKQDLKPGEGRIAAYAWGVDYHDLIPQKTNLLARQISDLVGRAITSKAYTDTGPILERDLAVQAGLGWIGKNSCLINPGLGSFFFLAELWIDLDLPPDEARVTDHCGNCSRCLKACPTGCITTERTLEAGRCISFLTIENKGLIPLEFVGSIRNEIFGCDICQQVCPWNIRFAPSSIDSDLVPEAPLKTIDLVELAKLTPQQFNKQFKQSPIKRAKRRGMLRNTITISDSSEESLTILRQLLEHDEEMARESARARLKMETKQ